MSVKRERNNARYCRKGANSIKSCTSTIFKYQSQGMTPLDLILFSLATMYHLTHSVNFHVGGNRSTRMKLANFHVDLCSSYMRSEYSP